MRDAKSGSARANAAKGAEGFSLIETLIAAAIVIVALTSLAQMFVIAAAANQRAKSRTLATVLAQEKLEELMAIDGDVLPGTDFIDGQGRRIGAGDSPPLGTVYIRRWIAEPARTTTGALVLHVRVTPSRQGAGWEAARIVSVKRLRVSWRLR